MAELFFTTADFIVEGMPRPGVPFLVDKNMEPVDVVDQWFFNVALVSGKTRSKNTWETYGRILYGYFQWLETFDKKWDTVSAIDMASWRNSMIENPNVNGKPCKTTTINHRLAITTDFYKWAKRKGFVDEVSWEMVNVRVRKGDTFLKHADASGGVDAVNELMLRTSKKDYEYLTKDQVKEVLRNLPIRRDQLIVCTMLETGMRREEVISLDINQIPHPQFHSGMKYIPVKIIGKGNKERTVVFSATLLQEIQKYILTVRRKCAKKWKEKHGTVPTKVWLTEAGTAINKRTFNNILTALSPKVGFSVYPHLFRHTYAYRYYAKTRDLVGLSKRLGHESVTTTSKYSHIDPEEMQGFDSDVIDDIEQTYLNAIEGYGE
jgi:site-specific recombinase XerD